MISDIETIRKLEEVLAPLGTGLQQSNEMRRNTRQTQKGPRECASHRSQCIRISSQKDHVGYGRSIGVRREDKAGNRRRDRLQRVDPIPEWNKVRWRLHAGCLLQLP